MNLLFALLALLFNTTAFSEGYLCRIDYFAELSRHVKDLVTLRSAVLFDSLTCTEKKGCSYNKTFGDIAVQIICQKSLEISVSHFARMQVENIELRDFDIVFSKAYTAGRSGLKIICTKSEIGEIKTAMP